MVVRKTVSKKKVEVKLVKNYKLDLDFSRGITRKEALSTLDDIMGEIPVQSISISEIENEIQYYSLPALQQKVIATHLIDILKETEEYSGDRILGFTTDYLVSKLKSFKKFTREEFEYQMNLQIKLQFLQNFDIEDINSYPSYLVEEFIQIDSSGNASLIQSTSEQLYTQIQNCKNTNK